MSHGPAAEERPPECQPSFDRGAACSRSRTSANRVIVDLIESGLEAKEREKAAFFDLADQLAHTSDRAEQKRLKEELARMTFGEP